MRKKILTLFGIFLLISLTSCATELIIIEKDKTEEQGNETSNTYNLMNIDYLTTDVKSSSSVEDTVDLIYDSVVAIYVEGVSNGSSFSAAGSGVLFGWDDDENISYVVTCFHVIEDATTIEVELSDDTTLEASYVGGYSTGDIAVLAIEGTDYTYASLYSDSDNLRLGSTVICIGNPLGTLPGSVSTGVVSYLNREVYVDSYQTMSLIQTDVAINSGNSGGGLFNSAGALIGIVNAKYSSEGIEGLGFAIPSNQVMSIIESISNTATYNSTTSTWQAGYVVGEFSLGFSISDGYYQTGGWPHTTSRQVVYLTDISSNTTTTGYGYVNDSDIVSSFSLDYQDETLTDITLTSISSSSDILSIIYNGDLSIGDTLTFVVSRNNSTLTISFIVTQYIYTI